MKTPPNTTTTTGAPLPRVRVRTPGGSPRLATVVGTDTALTQWSLYYDGAPPCVIHHLHRSFCRPLTAADAELLHRVPASLVETLDLGGDPDPGTADRVLVSAEPPTRKSARITRTYTATVIAETSAGDCYRVLSHATGKRQIVAKARCTPLAPPSATARP